MAQWAFGVARPRSGLACTGRLPDGSFFTASWYAGDDFLSGGARYVNRPRFDLCDKGGKLKAGSKAESLLTDKLKELRKEMIRDGNA